MRRSAQKRAAPALRMALTTNNRHNVDTAAEAAEEEEQLENSLTMLSESLDQKIAVLQDIQAYNAKQEKALTEQTPDLEGFDAALEEKEELIQRVEKLDEGFETLYARVKEDLNENRAAHADRIRELQEKIRRITDMSVAIQAEEARNKKLLEEYFTKAKEGIRQGRQSSKAAYDYYRNMSGAGITAPQFMDSKN